GCRRRTGRFAAMTALWGLLRKEAFHILRDRRTLVVVTLMPVLQVVIFGYAIRTDVRHVRLAIVDPSPDQATLAIRPRFAATDVFSVVPSVSRTADLEQVFQSGGAQGAVVFEPDFANRLGRGEPARVSIVADATEPNTGSLIQFYVLSVIEGYERELRS